MVSDRTTTACCHGGSWYVKILSAFQVLWLIVSVADLIFYQALAKFKHIRIYANAYVLPGDYKYTSHPHPHLLSRINDTTVPYVTAAIETSDPFIDYETNGLEVYVGDLANVLTNLINIVFFAAISKRNILTLSASTPC
jgi:hypothetical protein